MDRGRLRFNKKFLPLWKDDYYIAIITGGRGSGKSFAVGDFIENLSFEAGHTILFTRFTLDSASDSIIPEFEDKIDLEGHTGNFYITKKDIINLKSGSKILFRGIKTAAGNQTAKLKSIEGLTTWVLDEAEELWDEGTFNTIKNSIRKKGIKNRIILVLNPKSYEHWIYKRFFDDANVEPGFNGIKDNVLYIHTTYLDNLPNLGKEFINDAEKCKEITPELYAYEYLGDWVISLDGAIFRLDRLNRYKELNQEGTDLIYMDTADTGTDHFAAPIGRLIGTNLYIYDAIFNLANLNTNEDVVTERIQKYDIDRGYVETNAAGAYFMRNIKKMNPGFFLYGINSRSNKMGRILAQSGWIIENVYFPENPNEELYRFMVQLCRLLIDSKDNDDAADALAGLAMMIRRDFHIR